MSSRFMMDISRTDRNTEMRFTTLSTGKIQFKPNCCSYSMLLCENLLINNFICELISAIIKNKNKKIKHQHTVFYKFFYLSVISEELGSIAVQIEALCVY